MFLRNNLLFCVCVLIGNFLWITACTKNSSNRSENTKDKASLSVLEQIRERGALKVGLSAFNPWAMQDARGEWIGFEVDVARKFSKDLGVELELVPTAWSGIIPALLVGKFDIIIGGMSITPERAQQVKFSEPYEYVKMFLILSKNITVASLEELNDPKHRFAGRAGSSAATLTGKLFPNAQMKLFDDDGLQLQDVLNGQADGFIATSVEAVSYVAENPERIYIPGWGRDLNKEAVAFALPKQESGVESDLLNYANDWIKENWNNGFLEQKGAYWFESRDWTQDYQLPK